MNLKLKMLSRLQQDNSLEFLADLSVASALFHAVNGVVPEFLAQQ
jgi:hypothetical protein